MKELTQIRQAVIDALCDAGLHALAAFPDCRAPRDTPSTTVAVGAAEGTALGFCNYLGQQYDPEQGTVTECYGKLLDGEISVEIRGSRCFRLRADLRAGRRGTAGRPARRNSPRRAAMGGHLLGKRDGNVSAPGQPGGGRRSLPPWPGRTAKPSWTLP